MLIRVYTTATGNMVARSTYGRSTMHPSATAHDLALDHARAAGYSGVEFLQSYHGAEMYFKAVLSPRPIDALRAIMPFARDKRVGEAFATLHRTEKQNAVAFALEILRASARDHESGQTDLRNEASSSLASRMEKIGLLDEPIPYI